MLKLTVNLDTDQNLDIGEETVLNYNEGLLWKEFTQFHLKAEDVKIDESINHAIWERGIQKIPSKITVKAVKDDDGIVTATLAE